MRWWHGGATILAPVKPGISGRSRDRSICLSMLAGVAFSAILWPATPLYAQDPVVAKVSGVEIRKSDLALAAELGAAVPETLSDNEKQDYYIGYLADLVLMDKAAEQRGITTSAEFKQRLAMAQRKLSAQMLVQAVVAKAESSDELNKAYAEISKQSGKIDEVSAQQIVVRTEQEARDIVQELNGGKNFTELAKAKSIDPNAIDLGYFVQDQLLPAFGDIVFKLQKGQTSAPIRSETGWHVVRIEDRRKKVVGTFEQEKSGLREYLVRKAQVDLMTKLRSEAKVELVK
jgi:peptidyl-prolyl cis-trans isomerase C